MIVSSVYSSLARIALIVATSLSVPLIGVAQTSALSGNVYEQANSPVPHANVLLKTKDGEQIIMFRPTDNMGRFNFSLPDGFRYDAHYLEVNHLTFEPQRIPLEAGKAVYDFHLQARVNEIPEIRIGRRPHIEQEGDTLTYDVGSFVEHTDRSIGDALRRMPGIEVASNGRITYQGQAISAFYIDGDDLLEGKYGIGTRAIPHGMVLSVQVLKNHQPIKVLKDRVISRDVAVNLVIKDEAKLKMSGEARLGGGLPEQYYAEVNTMLFNNKYKLLNVLKGNNTGIDLFQDQDDLVAGLEVAEERRLLTTGTVGDPPLPRDRYYFNNSGGVFANNLLNLRNQWQVASNVDFVIDRNRMDYLNRSAIFTSTDSVVFHEELHRVNTPMQLKAKFRGERNAASNYFSNTLQLTYGNNRTNANLSGIGLGLAQSLRHGTWIAENNFQYIPRLANRDVVRLKWRVQSKKLPELLAINPASMVAHIDTLGIFDRLEQGVDISSVMSDAGIEYAPRPKGTMLQRYEVNATQEWQSLHSDIHLIEEDNHTDGGFMGNRLSWRKTSASARSIYSMKTGRMDWTLNLPLTFQQIGYKDTSFSMDNTQSDWLFTPSLYGRVKLTRASDISVRYRHSNRFSDLYSIYQGAILSNYRTLSANSPVLQRQRVHQIGADFKTGDPITMLFFKLGYDYSHITSNTASSFLVEEQITRAILVPLQNTIRNHQISADLSKFVFFLSGKSGIRIDWNLANQNQIVNGELLPYQNRSLTLRPDLSLKLLRRVQLRYANHLTWYRNEPRAGAAGFSQRLFMVNQSLQLTYSPKPYWHLSARGQQLHTDREQGTSLNYFFVDANVRYRVARWRTEFEFDWTNITNIRTFEYSMLVNNMALDSRYEIRGHMFLMKASFAF